MPLTLQQKEQFFHEVASGLTAGQPVREVFERGSKRRTRSRRAVYRSLLEHLGAGDGSAGDAFSALPDTFDSLDVSLIRAGESGGRLDGICKSLAEYYGLLHKARTGILNRLWYPIVLIHLAILLLSAPTIFSESVNAFLWEIGIAFAVVYGAAALLILGTRLVLRGLRNTPGTEQAVRWIPLVGGLRESLVATRFSMVLSMMVQAGAGVMAAFDRAGAACGSALWERGARFTMDAVRGGDTLANAVTDSGVFPERFCDAIHTAETNGRLDLELQRVAAQYQEIFRNRLDQFAEWVPRIIYFMVVLGIAYRIVTIYLGYLQSVQDLLE